KNMMHLLGKTGLSLLLALMPIFLSAAHNQKLHGFFGLSNYAGAVFYDGWIYFGDASHLDFSNQKSEAIQIINKSIEQYPIVATDRNNVPTSLEIYPSLIKSGYSSQQIMELYTQAVIDSITNNRRLTFKLLAIKIKDGLSPFITHLQTLPLPDETLNSGSVKNDFYDSETLSIPFLIDIQRKINAVLPVFYFEIYPYIVWFMVISTFFALYRKPSNLWIAFFTITVTRIFIPIIMGASLWRFALAGLVPLQILAVAWVLILWQGTKQESGEKVFVN
ncbi:MAG: hypothetical protein L3J16_04540, partial [Anaerolineales bacterium]|nr:hypothetical protein [Anaerolineales bacterium]